MEADKKSFYEQHKKEIWIVSSAIVGLIFIVLIPLLVQCIIDKDTTHKGSDDGWLGFWGGYLGAVIGVAGALIAIRIQLSYEKKKFEKENASRDNELSEEKKARKSEQVDNTFFNLLNLFVSQQNDIILGKDSEHESNKDLFEDMLNTMRINSTIEYIKQGIEFIYEQKSKLLYVLDKALEASNKFVEEMIPNITTEEKKILSAMRKDGLTFIEHEIFPGNDFEKVYSEQQRIERIKKLKKIVKGDSQQKSQSKDNDLDIGQIQSYLCDIIKENNILDSEFLEYLSKTFRILDRYTRDEPNIDLEITKKKNVVESAQDPYRKQVGSYFRIFHRIIKYLNENVDDEQIKKNYIGFLRANMNENQMAMIFYNISYTERGSGAIEELKGTGFFGEKCELNDIESAHFFSPETLVWGNYDLKKMQEFCL